jgi:hypothetical protein
MSPAELVTFPLRDLDDLSVELCSFSLARGDAKVILKKLAGIKCRVVLAPDMEDTDMDAGMQAGDESNFWENLGVKVEMDFPDFEF